MWSICHREADCWIKAKGGAKTAKRVAAATATTDDDDQQQQAARTIKAVRSEPVRDDEESLWRFGLRGESLTVGASSFDHDDWLLLDSGSMAHACGLDVATDLPVKPRKQTKLQSVDGSGISFYGQKQICLTLASEDKVDAKINFDVASVSYPVLSLGKILETGTQLVMNGRTGYLIRGSRRADVEVRNNVLMVRARRRHLPGSDGAKDLVMAPLTAETPARSGLIAPVQQGEIDDHQFDRMLEEFDQDAEEDRAEAAAGRVSQNLADVEAAQEDVPGPVAAAPPQPGLPTEAEHAQHSLTHVDIQPWREHCVRSRGRHKPHHRLGGGEDRTPGLVAFDYAFFGNVVIVEDAETTNDKVHAILVGCDSDSGMMFAAQVTKKGNKDRYLVAAVKIFFKIWA